MTERKKKRNAHACQGLGVAFPQGMSTHQDRTSHGGSQGNYNRIVIEPSGNGKYTDRTFDRVSKSNPCPICGKTDWCLVAVDGSAAICPRVALGAVKNLGEAGHLHVLVENGHHESNGKPKADGPPRIVATYDYRDENGDLLFQVVRKSNKDFPQRRPDGKGGWIYNLDGVEKVLYRLPELIDADPEATVYIPEGEKDVDRLHELGLVATCNPMGAGKWRDRYTEHLRGRNVVVLADNDEKGRRHAIHVLRSLHGKAKSVRLVEFPELPHKGDVSDFLLARPLDALLVRVEEAPEWKPPAEPEKVEAASRPAIEINTEQHRVLAETLAILPADPDLYRQGDVLVTIARHEEEKAKLHGGIELREAKGNIKSVQVGPATLSCRLTALVDFFSWRKNRDGEDVAVAVAPPQWLPKAILERKSFPSVRPLLGLVETPFPRSDGSLVVEPGYDPRTGYYYAPSVTIDPLPDKPTQQDAEKASDLIYEVVKQFPFAHAAGDYAVWLAGLLSVLARPAIDGPVPGFAIIGNRAGVGKGRLIDVIGTIATGRKVPCSSYPESNEEATKCRVALALNTTSIIHLDNLEEGRLYGSGPLDSGITATEFKDRILGVNDNPTLTLRAVWFLSGNKIAPGRDAYRRWLVCNLISALETPEERTDLEHPDLIRYVLERRGELVRAALIILAAHAEAGRPREKTWGFLGSFEAWDLIVRGAVWYATGADCNATRKVTAELSPDRVNKISLLDAWADLPGGMTNGTTIATVLELALETCHSDLKEVLSRFGKDGKLPSATKLGNIIRTMAGTPFDGKMFQIASTTGYHNAQWKVAKAN
jgi:putative DNA primase/helicase